MGTKSAYLGPMREENGNQVVTFGFTYRELSDIDEALYELLSYYEDMLDINDQQYREEVLGRISSLQMKVEMYRNHALRNKEEEEE